MGLTTGSGPFGERPAGRFEPALEHGGAVFYLDDDPRRIRALFARATIVDSRKVKLLHESGSLPVYYSRRWTCAATCSTRPSAPSRLRSRARRGSGRYA